MKNNAGISILQIVITIIILVIILSTTFFYGQNVSKEARMSTIYEEMKEIESAIQETYMLSNIKINSDSLTLYDQIEIPKVDASDYEAQLNGENEYNYYYLDFTSSKDLEKILEMENVDNDYILDFDNLNVYLVEGIEIDGKLIYNSDDFAKYYENIILK